MVYLITFVEGFLTFISPCILPLIPIYVSFLAGDDNGENNKNKMIVNALGFVLGFTIIFVLLGNTVLFISNILINDKRIIDIVGGCIIILFGLNFTNIIKLKFLNKTAKMKINIKPVSFLKAVLFGIVFAIGWTPCVGALLGSAIISATTNGTQIEGIILLVLYSIGLGIPFIISAIFIHEIKDKFDIIKKNYKIINMICGIFLIIVGIIYIFGGIR